MFSDYVFKWLDNALDMGLSEQDYWSMTLAEFDRFVASQRRIKERDAQEKAYYDWVLGDLIGRSISRIYGANNRYPKIYEAYPTIYSKEEMERKEQERKTELSALRLQEFAKSFNEKKNKKEVESNCE